MVGAAIATTMVRVKVDTHKLRAPTAKEAATRKKCFGLCHELKQNLVSSKKKRVQGLEDEEDEAEGEEEEEDEEEEEEEDCEEEDGDGGGDVDDGDDDDEDIDDDEWRLR